MLFNTNLLQILRTCYGCIIANTCILVKFFILNFFQMQKSPENQGFPGFFLFHFFHPAPSYRSSANGFDRRIITNISRIVSWNFTFLSIRQKVRDKKRLIQKRHYKRRPSKMDAHNVKGEFYMGLSTHL